MITVEPPIKDTPNKEHLSIKDKSTRPNSYYTSTFLPPNKGNLSIKGKTPCPNVSFIKRFHYIYHVPHECVRSCVCQSVLALSVVQEAHSVSL